MSLSSCEVAAPSAISVQVLHKQFRGVGEVGGSKLLLISLMLIWRNPDFTGFSHLTASRSIKKNKFRVDKNKRGPLYA